MSLSIIPDLTAAVGVPRLAAAEHPFGQTIGPPVDDVRQRDVLKASLGAAQAMFGPGAIEHLPFDWPTELEAEDTHPPELPPIVDHLTRHPWQNPRLFDWDLPGKLQRCLPSAGVVEPRFRWSCSVPDP